MAASEPSHSSNKNILHEIDFSTVHFLMEAILFCQYSFIFIR